MKPWKIFLIFIVGMSLSHTPVRAENLNIGGNMGSESTMTVGSVTGNLHFIGYASPNAVVFFMENGQVVGTTLADSNSAFDKTLTNLSPGIHNIGVYARDIDSINTATINYNINIPDHDETLVRIILPPSFSIGSTSVKRPDPFMIHGRGENSTSVQFIITGSRDDQLVSTTIDAGGAWSLSLNPKLHLGSKTAYGLILDRFGGQSEISQTINYTILRSADLNNDGRVNLTDFSILMYSYGRLPLRNAIADINDDGKADLVDFSIMMSNWSR